MEAEKMQGGRNPAKVNTILPDDIIEEILSRLPAKSLLRFRSVHKQWLSLISHPNFVQSNLKHLLSHNHHQKLGLLRLKPYHFFSTDVDPKPSYQLSSIDYESPGGGINAVKFDIPLPILPYSSISIIGSCNGLLCIRTEILSKGDQFIIWNPLLKNYKQVTDHLYDPHRFPRALVGFGYDSVSEDHKLVRVDLNDDLVNVYTLKTNSSRSFPLEPPSISYTNCLSGDCRGKLFNGSLYWLASYNEWREYIVPKLIWFDLKDEKFRMVDIPGDHYHDRYLSWEFESWGSELIVARECLCIVTMDTNNLHLKLLMMKVDKCNVISWSVGPNLEQPYGLCERPICITNDGGVLMLVKDNFGLKDKRLEEVHNEYKLICKYGSLDGCSYYKLIINNPHKGTIDNIPVQGLRDWFEGTTYLETLVSPI